VYQVYAKGSTDGLGKMVAKSLRLPVMKVNGQSINYGDYVGDLAAIKKVREYDAANAGPAAGLSDEQLSDQVLIRIVNNILVADEAKKLNITLADSEVAEVHDSLLKELGTEEGIEKEIANRYGWNYATYEMRVIRPLLLQNKVAEVISTDVAAREAVGDRAKKVLYEIKNGGDFAALAKQYGDDGTANNGGSLGEFSAGDMVPPFEEAVKKLKKGELAQELVETQYGYHIVKLDNVRSEKVKDENGKTVSKTFWDASHILFAYPNINKTLSARLKESTINLYIKVHDPFKDLTTRV
jgi:parvulin-like peptidyl-prolyl isomerase